MGPFWRMSKKIFVRPFQNDHLNNSPSVDNIPLIQYFPCQSTYCCRMFCGIQSWIASECAAWYCSQTRWNVRRAGRRFPLSRQSLRNTTSTLLGDFPWAFPVFSRGQKGRREDSTAFSFVHQKSINKRAYSLLHCPIRSFDLKKLWELLLSYLHNGWHVGREILANVNIVGVHAESRLDSGKLNESQADLSRWLCDKILLIFSIFATELYRLCFCHGLKDDSLIIILQIKSLSNNELSKCISILSTGGNLTWCQ